MPALRVPWPEAPEDPEVIEHLKAAQTAAGELQWLVGWSVEPDLICSTLPW